jgi:hypothetical protein
MPKLIMPYFQPLLTLPLSIGHGKHPFGYVMDFENLWTFIARNKP